MGVADIHGMGETGTRMREPQGSYQCPGIRKDSAGETQGTGKEEGTPVWPVAGLGAACKCLGPDPTAPPALGGADE